MTAHLTRILDHLATARGGTSTPDEGGWAIDVPEPAFQFTQRIDGVVLSCDAPLETYSIEQAKAVAAFERDLADAITRERITFATFDELAAYLAEHHDVEHGIGYIAVDTGLEHRIAITAPETRGEDWIELALPFSEDAAPTWLLAQNGLLVGLAFEVAPSGSIGLRWSMPLVAVTAQRLHEMLAALGDNYERLVELYNAPELWPSETGAIVGPWPDKAACLRAFEAELADLGWPVLADRDRGCTIARIYEIGDTAWISAETFLVARLAYEVADAHVFGVEVEYGPSGNRCVAVDLFSLDLDEDGDLVKLDALGTEPADLDANEAGLFYELRLAAQIIGVDVKDVVTTSVFYRDDSVS